jgi:hypothetical protein
MRSRTDALVIVGSAIAVLLGGSVVALGAPLLTGTLLAIAIGVLTLCMSTWAATVCLFVMTFFIQGSVRFFAGTNILSWATSGLALILLAKALYQRLGLRQSPAVGGVQVTSSANLALSALVIYLLLLVTSALINQSPVLQLIAAFRNTVPMLAVLAVIYWSPWTTSQLKTMWMLLLAGVFLQLPIVAYQHFVIAAERKTQGWDAVVGTLGGNPEGGGLNAMLVIFALAGLAFVLARVRYGLSKPLFAWIVGLAVAIIIALGEVKAAFVWGPFVLLWFFGRDLMRRPLRTVAYSAGALVLVGALFVAYQEFYWQAKSRAHDSIVDRIAAQSEYFFNPRNIDFRTGEVSRGASLAIWWNDPRADVIRRTVGYGPGASKSVSVLGAGEVAKRYSPLAVDATTVVVLLWDTGIAGFLLYTAVLVFSVLAGLRLTRAYPATSPDDASLIDASVLTLVLLTTLLIYNRTLADEPTVQFLTYLCIGTVFHYSNSFLTNVRLSIQTGMKGKHRLAYASVHHR